MTKEEILKLHTLSESEQIKSLTKNNILKSRRCQCHPSAVSQRWESLADCAFRLRDEWLKDHDKVEEQKYACFDELLSKLQAIIKYSNNHFICYAKPINWIQVCELEKLEQGE